MLVSDGDDIRKLPLRMRKASLARLLVRSADGIFLSDFERGEIGPDLFGHACLMGLEGLVSKRADSRYRSGRSPDWIKVENPKSPAMNRVKDSFNPSTGDLIGVAYSPTMTGAVSKKAYPPPGLKAKK